MSEHFAAVTVSAYLHICIHNIFRVEERRGTCESMMYLQ